MNFNAHTVSVLKNFATINPSLLFRPGKTLKTISPAKTILAKAHLNEEITQEFAIYDLHLLIKTLSLFDHDHDVVFDEKCLTIKSSGQSFLCFFAHKDIVIAPPEKDMTLDKPDISFNLPEEPLTKLMTALSILEFPHIGFVADGEKVAIVTYDPKNPTSNKFSIDIAPTDKKFTVIFKKANLKLVEDSYRVSLFKKGMGHFEGSSIEYLVAFEANHSSIETESVAKPIDDESPLGVEASTRAI